MAFRFRTGTQKQILLQFILALCLSYPLYADAARDTTRSDLIHIRVENPPGAFKMPGVVFAHDLHTRALGKNSCNACHMKKNSGFAFRFYRLENLGYDKDKDLYHAHCIGCHEDLCSHGKSAGPQTGECRICHAKDTVYTDMSQPFGLDKSLHYRHILSEAILPMTNPGKDKDENCSTCHHQYDRTLKKTVYAKGQEETCRYCHMQKKTEDARSFQTVAHDACVNCHLKLNWENVKAGPDDCAGCHDPSRQMKIAKIKDVPRIKRNQPDTVLMTSWMDDARKTRKTSAQFVPGVAFDHLFHENKTEHCRYCHHASLDACGSCHTRTGDQKWKMVTLDQAMHQASSSLSCIGCHDKIQDKPECAGCHYQLPETCPADALCINCHSISRQAMDPLPQNKETAVQVAEEAIKNHQFPKRISDDETPDKVTIDLMSNQYDGVLFPHRQIVRALFKRMENSGLALYFHNSPTSVCHGCHHHSPSVDTFPKCASCHEVSENMGKHNRPGLKGAYHGQCISCHQRMGIEKPAAADCAACHKQKDTAKMVKQ